MFNIGDVVKLKNDLSPPMTVIDFAGDEVVCMWFGANWGEVREYNFPKALLRVLPQREPR